MKNAVLGLIAFVVLVACQSQGNFSQASRTVLVPFTPDVSINEIMVAQIDHAAHELWNMANPKNSVEDVNWLEVEHHAIQLISSRSAMTMGGAGANDAMWVAQASWRGYTDQMNEAALQALAAGKARSMRSLEAAGDYLVDVCEACHQQYKPSIPTEGVMHPH